MTDLWTVSLSGTVISQTYTFTMNGKSISYTSTGGDTVATILTAVVTLWNTSTNPPEFLELTAVGLPVGGPFTSMTITQKTSGIPSTISVATGGAATFSITNTTVATGPSFFDNAQNWSGGVAPANSDVLVFDNGNVGCFYNISTVLTGITLQVQGAFAGTIGLPFINVSGNSFYNEYRTTSLTLAGGTAIINAPNVGRCNLAFGATTTNIRVLGTGTRIDNNIPVILIQGGNSSSELDISKGDVGVAFYLGQTATFPVVKSGYVSQAASDVNLYLGAGCTLTTVTKNGGTAIIKANLTTLNQNAQGGIVTLVDAVTATTVNVYGGTFYLNSTGTIATVNLYNQAMLNCDADPRAKAITNSIGIFSSAVTVMDTAKTVNSGTLTLAMNNATGVNYNHGSNTTLTIT